MTKEQYKRLLQLAELTISIQSAHIAELTAEWKQLREKLQACRARADKNREGAN